jgi:hypothetical protein
VKVEGRLFGKRNGTSRIKEWGQEREWVENNQHIQMYENVIMKPIILYN